MRSKGIFIFLYTSAFIFYHFQIRKKLVVSKSPVVKSPIVKLDDVLTSSPDIVAKHVKIKVKMLIMMRQFGRLT